MKKVFTIPSILLASLISFSVSANVSPIVKSHPHSGLELIQAKQHHSFASEKNQKLDQNDLFEEVLTMLQNNTIDYFYLGKDFQVDIDQTLQLLAALKNNTSVNHYYIFDQNLFDKNNKEANAPVIAALIDVLNTKPIITVSINNDHAWDKDYVPFPMDEDTFAQIAAVLSGKPTLKEFAFEAYETTPAIADSIALFAKNPNLEWFSAGLTSTEDATDAVRVAKALAQSQARTIQLFRRTNELVMDTQVAQLFAEAAIANTNLKDWVLVDYRVDETAAALFAQAIAQNAPHDIHFWNNGITDDTFAILQPALEQNSALSWLGAGKQQLTDVAPLVNLYNNHNLYGLWISYASQNPIDSASLNTLTTKLATDSKLNSLGLDGLGINDEGAQLLAQAIVQNSVLRSLSLEDNYYTVVGARALMNTLETNQRLYWFDLDKKAISEIPEEELSVFWQRLFKNGQRG
jgi:hypothetical protein